MSRKLFSLAILFGAFMFMASAASAQLNFFNGSGCFVQIDVTAEQNATPCSGALCAANPVVVPPGGSATINPPCLTTPAGLGYRSIKVTVFGGPQVGVDKCSGPNPAFFLDCNGVARQLVISSNTFAAIF